MNKIRARGFISFFIILMILVYFPPIAKGGYFTIEQNIKPKVFLELINVESFEGGRTSRGDYLKKVALNLQEKENIYILIKTMSLQEFNNSGKTADIYSFSVGAGEIILPNLAKYDGKLNVRDDLLAGGMVSNIVYGVPWSFSGYSIIESSVKDKGTSFGTNNVISPLVALLYSNKRVDGLNTTLKTPYEAYTLAVRGNSTIITLRDLHRINDRIKSGNMNERLVAPLSGFTDLVMYLGINSKLDALKQVAATKFVESVTSDIYQKKLVETGLLSVTYSNLYSDSTVSSLEKALAGEIKTVNAFTNSKQLSELNILAYSAYFGDNNAKAKLNDILSG